MMNAFRSFAGDGQERLLAAAAMAANHRVQNNCLSAAGRLNRNYMKGLPVLLKLQGGYANDSYANEFEGPKRYSAK